MGTRYDQIMTMDADALAAYLKLELGDSVPVDWLAWLTEESRVTNAEIMGAISYYVERLSLEGLGDRLCVFLTRALFIDLVTEFPFIADCEPTALFRCPVKIAEGEGRKYWVGVNAGPLGEVNYAAK